MHLWWLMGQQAGPPCLYRIDRRARNHQRKDGDGFRTGKKATGSTVKNERCRRWPRAKERKSSTFNVASGRPSRLDSGGKTHKAASLRRCHPALARVAEAEGGSPCSAVYRRGGGSLPLSFHVRRHGENPDKYAFLRLSQNSSLLSLLSVLVLAKILAGRNA